MSLPNRGGNNKIWGIGASKRSLIPALAPPTFPARSRVGRGSRSGRAKSGVPIRSRPVAGCRAPRGRVRSGEPPPRCPLADLRVGHDRRGAPRAPAPARRSPPRGSEDRGLPLGPAAAGRRTTFDFLVIAMTATPLSTLHSNFRRARCLTIIGTKGRRIPRQAP